jgi:hypothetical protein
VKAKPRTKKKAKQTQTKTSKAKQTQTKTSKAKKLAERGIVRAGPKPAYEILDLYLRSVAANQGLGLQRSLDMSLDMFQYEFRLEYGMLEKEARNVIDRAQAATIVALAKKLKIAGLGEAEVDAASNL